MTCGCEYSDRCTKVSRCAFEDLEDQLRREMAEHNTLLRRHLEYWQAMPHAPGCASDTPNWKSIQAACNCPIGRAIGELEGVMV